MTYQPEQEVTDTLRRLIEHPKPCRCSISRRQGAPGGSAGLPWRPAGGTRAAGLKRTCRIWNAHPGDLPPATAALCPKGITVIEPGDEVFFLARKQDIPSVMRDWRMSGRSEGHDRRRRQYRRRLAARIELITT